MRRGRHSQGQPSQSHSVACPGSVQGCQQQRSPDWVDADQLERPEMGGSRQPHCRGCTRITIIVFARCLLVCPGTGRHCLTSAGTETAAVVHDPVLCDTESIDLIAEQRTLNPQVRRRKPRNRRRHDPACDSRITSATLSRPRQAFARRILLRTNQAVLAQRRTEPYPPPGRSERGAGQAAGTVRSRRPH